MNCQKDIENVFKAMATYIAQYLLHPEGSAEYGPIYSIGVRLKSCDIDDQYPSVEPASIVTTPNPRQLFYRLTKPIDMPFRPQISIGFSLRMVDVDVYCIVMETTLIDENNLRERQDYPLKGTLEKLRNQVLGNQFAKPYARQCLQRIKELDTEIEEENKYIQRRKFEASLDITDFDAVMPYVEALPKGDVSHLGKGFLAVNINRATVLIDTNEKKCYKGDRILCNIILGLGECYKGDRILCNIILGLGGNLLTLSSRFDVIILQSFIKSTDYLSTYKPILWLEQLGISQARASTT